MNLGALVTRKSGARNAIGKISAPGANRACGRPPPHVNLGALVTRKSGAKNAIGKISAPGANRACEASRETSQE